MSDFILKIYFSHSSPPPPSSLLCNKSSKSEGRALTAHPYLPHPGIYSPPKHVTALCIVCSVREERKYGKLETRNFIAYCKSGRVDSILNSYSGASSFESQPRNYISRLIIFVVFLSPARKFRHSCQLHARQRSLPCTPFPIQYS